MNEELLMLTWKGAVNQELGKEGRWDERKEGRGNESKDETVLVPNVIAMELKSAVNYSEVFYCAVCTYPNPHIMQYVLLLNAFGGLNVFIYLLFCHNSSILNKHEGPKGRGEIKKEREAVYHITLTRLYHTKQGWHCWAPWWRRVGISFRAAQNYTETYYLQLKATQVSVIHTTQLPTGQQPTKPGALLWSRLEALYHPFVLLKTYYLALCRHKREAHLVRVTKKGQE